MFTFVCSAQNGVVENPQNKVMNSSSSPEIVQTQSGYAKQNKKYLILSKILHRYLIFFLIFYDSTQGGGNKRDRRHWEDWEDTKLIEFVERHGARDWKLISAQLHGRSGDAF